MFIIIYHIFFSFFRVLYFTPYFAFLRRLNLEAIYISAYYFY